MAETSEFAFFTLLQFVVTWVMVGMIWFIQTVHYPLYKKIKEGFVEYERSHIRKASLLIGPFMLVEAFSAIVLLKIAPDGVLTKLAALNLILLIFIWLSTSLVQISQHQKLSVRFSRKILKGLIHSNWVRTLLWTIKGCLLVVIIYFLL